LNVYNSVLDMYVLYIQLANLALEDPTGTFNSFNTRQSSLRTEFEALAIRTRAMLPATE